MRQNKRIVICLRVFVCARRRRCRCLFSGLSEHVMHSLCKTPIRIIDINIRSLLQTVPFICNSPRLKAKNFKYKHNRKWNKPCAERKKNYIFKCCHFWEIHRELLFGNSCSNQRSNNKNIAFNTINNKKKKREKKTEHTFRSE